MNYRPHFNLAAFDSLESQQKRLALLGKTAQIGEWSYVCATNFTVWSDYLYDFYEVDKHFECSDLLQNTHFYQGLEKEKMQALIAQVTATKTEHSDDFMIVMRDGRVKWHTTTIHPVLDARGNLTGLYGILQNITARKQSGLELQRMAYVAEKTNGIVMITDSDKKIIWINHSFEKILGYRPEEVIGLDPAAFLQGPETSVETIREIARSLRSSGTFSGEILNYTKSGEKIWLYLNIAAVYDDAGKLINYVAVENDITLIKMAEHRLQKAIEKERELNRFKTQFVNLASHQFRTPLATIRSSIDLLDLKMESADVNPSFVDLFRRHKAIMTEETVRMTELMENILDIGRIDEGKIELSKKQCSFKQFMDSFVESNREPAGQQRKLAYRFDAPDRIIGIDEILMRNVLRNIVSNAFKYSEGKQAPELTVTFRDNTYFIAVKDYGIGIPEKDQLFLFQSFYRASNAKVFPGSGLGLMIARKLIMLHGGDIQCQSAIGDGCLITIQLSI
jgi:PAS domain S-box-containing protein